MSSADEQTAPGPPLLFVGQQDTSRLLEVYVKRSLSLNDGSPYAQRQSGRQRKWVTLAEQKSRRNRMHSSDTSLHLSVDRDDLEDSAFGPAGGPAGSSIEPQTGDKAGRQRWNTLRTRWKSFRDKGRRPSKPSKPASAVVKPSGLEHNEAETAASDLESSTEKPGGNQGGQTKPAGKNDKKPKASFWKSIIGFFSRGDSDTDNRGPSTVRTVDETQPDEPLPSPQVTCLPLPRAFPDREEGSPRRRKSIKRRRSRKRLSLKLDRPSSLVIEGVERVEPTHSYYENVSEELKKIVTEVKESPTEEHAAFPPTAPPTNNNNYQSLSAEEVIQRLIYLIKEEGDVLNAKIQESPSLVSFFQDSLTYGSFQQLADQYVQSEIPAQPVQDPVVAPELVKLAFTLDFTARLASLSRQSPSHIMGLGNRYLQDRFTYLTEAPSLTPTTQPVIGPGEAGDRGTHT